MAGRERGRENNKRGVEKYKGESETQLEKRTRRLGENIMRCRGT